MNASYWTTQTSTKPLYPDIEWNKPERRDQAGRLGIVGGNKAGFAGVANAYSTVLDAGVGEVRVLLPAVLKKAIPTVITDTVYAPANPSGGLSQDAEAEFRALAGWACGLLFVGDAGRNSETAILYETILRETDIPITLTRDAIDLVKNSSHILVERPQTLIVASFAQAQKLFQSVYFPKMLTFSLPLMQVVDIMHKFTISYPVTMAVLHKDHIILAHGGQVITQAWDSPMRIWRGETAARMASYWLWNPNKPLESIAASIATAKSVM